MGFDGLHWIVSGVFTCNGKSHENEDLTGNSKNGLSGLLNTCGNGGDNEVDDDGEKGGKKGGKAVVNTTILGYANHTVDDETDEIHPRHRGGEGETSNDRIEGLGFKLLSYKRDGRHLLLL